MATKVIMPQGGQDITEGTVVNWLKAEGETVKKGEVICEVETEKAVFEVQAPTEGVLLKIIAKEGEKVPIFSTIGMNFAGSFAHFERSATSRSTSFVPSPPPVHGGS